MRAFMLSLLFFVSLAAVHAAPQPRRPASSRTEAPFTTSLTLAQMSHKQAVVETSQGTFVID